ncbi:LysR family transcriptional regulator [Streptomyces sp. MST-110588]|uniref:LysR family transcriptional regulator n=1 Tax=Streptomyces sp. MST-110588 TaxID=2833628 RepID=UPI001F5D293F|nr:LysR family transcriptional regulator [Streptomyces sp. MST-110588]UNO41788.1 LysR family transcriptional regulator [Streptomyces sp. MST-110588]
MDYQETECFLTLAEELHFGRTAERMMVSQARVSQLTRSLERRVGGRLFERTTRSVRLTDVGERYRERVAPAFQELRDALDEARRATRCIEETLRVGFLCATMVVPEIIRRFRARFPACATELHEVHIADPLGPLRRGEIDVLSHWLPVLEDDLEVGPTMSSEPRTLAVPLGHPLASRESISVEELAEQQVFSPAGNAPQYWWDAQSPPCTPSGKPIRRGQPVATVHEVLSLVAAGQGLAPMVRSTAEFYARPDVAFVPIHDLPNADVALVWRKTGRKPVVAAFAETAETYVQG